MKLDIKYRPQTWEDLIGQDTLANSVRQIVDSSKGDALMLSGPSGCGKTTVGYLIARHLGLDPDIDHENVIYVNGSNKTGVDDMRELLAKARRRPFSKKQERVIIIDEGHYITKNAWSSALADLENIPEGVFWVICTTNPKKIPKDIHTRCHPFEFTTIPDTKIEELVQDVAKKEDIELDDKVIDLLLFYADGVPRVALKALDKIRGVTDLNKINQLLESNLDDDDADVASFCKLLMSKNTAVGDLYKSLGKVENPNPFGIQRQVSAWFTKLLLSGKSRDPEYHSAVILAFADTYPDDATMGNVCKSVAEVMFNRQ